MNISLYINLIIFFEINCDEVIISISTRKRARIPSPYVTRQRTWNMHMRQCGNVSIFYHTFANTAMQLNLDIRSTSDSLLRTILYWDCKTCGNQTLWKIVWHNIRVNYWKQRIGFIRCYRSLIAVQRYG